MAYLMLDTTCEPLCTLDYLGVAIKINAFGSRIRRTRRSKTVAGNRETPLGNMLKLLGEFHDDGVENVIDGITQMPRKGP